MSEYIIYKGTGEPHEAIANLGGPPPWRNFVRSEKQTLDQPAKKRGADYVADETEIDMVNASLHLRRPLLITGRPGVGKSSLPYAVAYELGLGDVLTWPISTKSTLQSGLYSYDAIGRLQAKGAEGEAPDIGDFIKLGPLGTALLRGDKPRVLLIDELDKSDVDLPNDLLNVLEEGYFEIPELQRWKVNKVKVKTSDPGGTFEIENGVVRCDSRSFPVVFMTSNGEREFPPPFLRRCLRLKMDAPSRERLMKIVEQHLGEITPDRLALIGEFFERMKREEIAVDQLLNAIFVTSGEITFEDAYDLKTPNEQRDEWIQKQKATLNKALTEKLSVAETG